MGKQRNQFSKFGLVAVCLITLAACGATSETDDAGADDGGQVASTPPAATSSASNDSGQLSAEQIRQQEALRQTVFYFDFDVAEFKPEDRQTLTYHARDLAANSGKRVRLEGHADERGTREYNLALGERRANGIMNYLIVNGASRSQIEVVSYGEERPAARGQTEQSYSRNRRVQVVVR